MVVNFSQVGWKYELDQIQANSSQVGGQTIPSLDQVENLAQVGLSWENHVARAKLPPIPAWKLFWFGGVSITLLLPCTLISEQRNSNQLIVDYNKMLRISLIKNDHISWLWFCSIVHEYKHYYCSSDFNLLLLAQWRVLIAAMWNIYGQISLGFYWITCHFIKQT